MVSSDIEKLSIRKKGLRCNLLVAEALVFILPFIVLAYIIYKSNIVLNLTPFGRTFDSCIFHSLLVTAWTTKNRHETFLVSPLEIRQPQLKINNGFVYPYLTLTPATAIVVFLWWRTEGPVLLYIHQSPLVRTCLL